MTGSNLVYLLNKVVALATTHLLYDSSLLYDPPPALEKLARIHNAIRVYSLLE